MTDTAAGAVTGGDLPYGEEKRRAVRAMFDEIAPRYELVNSVMTFGLDSSWRRRCVAALGLQPGSLVLDVGCGTGDLVVELGRVGMSPAGLDLSAGMLGEAASRRLPLVLGDAASSPFAAASLDGAVSAFTLRNFSDLDAVLAELARAVRPGGRVSLLEVSTPGGRLMRLGHRVWFGLAVPLIGRLLARSDAYRYLPRSVAYLPSPAALVARIEEHGFTHVTRTPLTGGVVQLLTGTRA